MLTTSTVCEKSAFSTDCRRATAASFQEVVSHSTLNVSEAATFFQSFKRSAVQLESIGVRHRGEVTQPMDKTDRKENKIGPRIGPCGTPPDISADQGRR